jgi:hypothetical protein
MPPLPIHCDTSLNHIEVRYITARLLAAGTPPKGPPVKHSLGTLRFALPRTQMEPSNPWAFNRVLPRTGGSNSLGGVILPRGISTSKPMGGVTCDSVLRSPPSHPCQPVFSDAAIVTDGDHEGLRSMHGGNINDLQHFATLSPLRRDQREPLALEGA